MYGTNPTTKSLLDGINKVMASGSKGTTAPHKDSVRDTYESMVRNGSKKIDETTLWQAANPTPVVEDEDLFEVFDLSSIDMLEEGEGSLKGLPSHIKKVITGSKHQSNLKGGENSPVTDHGRVTSHGNFRSKLHNAMKDTAGVHVIHVAGKPVAAVHTSYHARGVRDEHNVDTPEGKSTVRKSRQVDKGGYDRRAQKYYPPRYHEFDTPSHSKEETLNKVIHGIVGKHIDSDMENKDTYKLHHISIKSYGHDKERMKKREARKEAKNIENDTLQKHKESAINKMADKHVSEKSPLDKTKELHKALGHAIEKGDHVEVRQHLNALQDHTRYKDSLTNDSLEKQSYKSSLKDLQSKHDWNQRSARNNIKRLKEKGVVKEEVENLDEPSKDTLKDYSSKALAQKEKTSSAGPDYKTYYKRKAGLRMADNKIHSESFKRGDLIHVPGGEGTKHPAVHLGGNKAVYLDDDGAVEHVPIEAIANSKKMLKTSKRHKELASKYLENMKEEVENIDELSQMTLRRYVNKAVQDTGMQAMKFANNVDSEKGTKALKRMAKHGTGINLATAKLAPDTAVVNVPAKGAFPKKKTNEEVALSQEEIDRLEQISSSFEQE